MKTKIYLLLVLWALSFSVANGQCVKNTCFQAGEIIRYKAVYNWGFIWVDSGEVSFEVEDSKYGNKEVFHLKSVGSSLPKYDWFFKVRDYFDSYVDKTSLRPYKYVRNTYEGGYKVYNRYYFDYAQNVVRTFSENTDKPLVKDTFQLKPCTFDLITAIYYVRNIDYTAMSEGQTVPLSLIVDNEMTSLYIRYVKRETIEHPETKKKYRCIQLKVKLMAGTIFSGGEDVTVWVTDDKNKIPILIEAKILVGAVKAMLDNYEGLKHPFSSEVK